MTTIDEARDTLDTLELGSAFTPRERLLMRLAASYVLSQIEARADRLDIDGSTPSGPMREDHAAAQALRDAAASITKDMFACQRCRDSVYRRACRECEGEGVVGCLPRCGQTGELLGTIKCDACHNGMVEDECPQCEACYGFGEAMRDPLTGPGERLTGRRSSTPAFMNGRRA